MQVFNIGRDAGNQIVLNDNLISRRHAQLIISDSGQVMIKDLNSSNGTFVNGNRITECYLHAGDIVKCGAEFINWTHYTMPESGPDQKINYQEPEFKPQEYQEPVYDKPENQYGIGGVFKYLATRIFDTGDLFKTNWKKTNTILFLTGIPLVTTLAVSLIYLQKYPHVKFTVIPSVLAIFQFAVCPFIAVYLLSFFKKASIDKVALASGIIGFISFSVFFIFSAPQLFNLKTRIPFFNFGFPGYTNLFQAAVLFLLIFLVLCLIISLFIFIYRYYISIGVSNSVSVYLVIATLIINLFFQLLFTYLIFLILKNNFINPLL